MLTRQKLTTDAGYVKYRSRRRAMKIARKMGLSDTHSHQAGGDTIYMPGGDHRSLNAALRARGLPETPMPGDGMMRDDAMAMGMMPDDPADTQRLMPDTAQESDLGMGVNEGDADDMMGDGLLDGGERMDLSFTGSDDEGGLFDELGGSSHNSNDDDDSRGGLYG